MKHWRQQRSPLKSARRNWLLLLILLLSSGVSAQDRHLYTYSMRHAVPEQVLPALEPQLSAGSSIRAFQNQLILNVTATEYRDVLGLLEQLDVAARSLLISVRKGNVDSGSASQYGVAGRIGSGNVQVRSGDGYSPRPSSRTSPYLEGRAIDSASSGSRNNSQQVRAVEGMPAFIAVGASYPVTTRSSAYGSTRALVPVESGFYATARVIGDDVVIDIDQRDDRVQGRRIATQGIQTQVRGRIGDWITLGNIDSSDQNNESGLLSTGSARQSSSGDIAIKVEIATP